MVNSYCAHNCIARDVKETRKAGITFYRIPVKEPKRTLWLNAIGRKDFNPKPHTVVCSQHFVGGRKSDDALSPAYTPSIFSFTPSPMKRRAEQGMERYEAAKRRREEKDRTEAADALVALASETDDVVYPVNTVTVATQTDLKFTDLSALEGDNQRMTTELAEVCVAKGYPSQEDLKSNEKVLRFYTGFSSFMVLMAFFNLVSAAIPEGGAAKLTQFILTLMKLRLNASNYDLGFQFGVSESTVSRVFTKWIEAMDIRLSFLISWPDRESIRKTMPFCFRPHYGLQIISIIDCFELFIEKPSDLLAKSCTWLHYNTAKYLISITPQGVISFISNGWGGRVSDKYIVEHSGFLSNLLPGDVILADRGVDVADSVAMLGATLDTPAFTRGCDQLPPSEVEATRKLANVRIHVERIIGAVRQCFQILSATGVLQKELLSHKTSRGIVLDSVVRVCCALNNVLEGIVPFD